MYGLPSSTEVTRQLPKAAIYRKFNLSSKDQELIDRDVSRLDIVNEISGRTTAINPGEKVQAFFVVRVQLKRLDYDPNAIIKLMNLIGQKCIFVLAIFGDASFVCHYSRLFATPYQKESEVALALLGHNLDAAWDYMLADIIGVDHIEETSLDFQVKRKIRLLDMYADLEKLKKNEKKELQPRRKQELHAKVVKLKKGIEELESNPLMA